MHRTLITADHPLRRPVLAAAAWAALLGGWLALASVAGLWPFAQEAAVRSLQPAAAAAPVSGMRPADSPVSRAADITAPELPQPASPSHMAGERSAASEVEVVWTEPFDLDSGVAGYSYTWSELPDTAPDPVVLATGETRGVTSASLPAGAWWFHLRAVDRAGNWSAAVHLGPFVIGPPPAATVPPAPVGATAPQPVRTAAAPTVAPRAVAPVSAPAATPAPAPAMVASPAATVAAAASSTPAGEASRPLTPQPSPAR